MKLPWKYIFLAFLLGFFMGGTALLAMRHFYPRGFKTGVDAPLKRFSGELALTEDQRTRIKTILAANREKMKIYRQEIRTATRADIRKLLTPDQQKRFDTLEARRDAFMEKRRARFKR